MAEHRTVRGIDFETIAFRDEDAISNRLSLITDLMATQTGDQDMEIAHKTVDGLLVEAVRSLGQFAGRVDAVDRLIRYYQEVGKWYS